MKTKNITRGNASQFFVAGELCRRGHAAVVTLGNCPNTDVLCTNTEGTRFVHIQVKTYAPGAGKCTVGQKSEIDYGRNFFWVLVGLPRLDQDACLEFYVLPSRVVAKNIKMGYEHWLKTPGKKGQPHNPTAFRSLHLPPKVDALGWDVSKYKNRWDLIDKKLAC